MKPLELFAWVGIAILIVLVIAVFAGTCNAQDTTFIRSGKLSAGTGKALHVSGASGHDTVFIHGTVVGAGVTDTITGTHHATGAWTTTGSWNIKGPLRVWTQVYFANDAYANPIGVKADVNGSSSSDYIIGVLGHAFAGDGSFPGQEIGIIGEVRGDGASGNVGVLALSSEWDGTSPSDGGTWALYTIGNSKMVGNLTATGGIESGDLKVGTFGQYIADTVRTIPSQTAAISDAVVKGTTVVGYYRVNMLLETTNAGGGSNTSWKGYVKYTSAGGYTLSQFTDSLQTSNQFNPISKSFIIYNASTTPLIVGTTAVNGNVTSGTYKMEIVVERLHR